MKWVSISWLSIVFAHNQSLSAILQILQLPILHCCTMQRSVYQRVLDGVVYCLPTAIHPPLHQLQCLGIDYRGSREFYLERYANGLLVLTVVLTVLL